ncbi:MAG: uncharacterized protein QG597_3613 [Actinomycetota bacterium]|nr:uncharacterized protein [Actinomycetota bacterium]
MTASDERAFIDANVLFSAAIGSGVCQIVLTMPSVVCLTSDYCFDEARRNLTAKAPPEALAWLLSAVEDMEVVTTPPPDMWDVIAHHLPARATTDLPVLAASVTARAHTLITGNTRDFGGLMTHPVPGLPVVYTPRAFLLRGPRSA